MHVISSRKELINIAKRNKSTPYRPFIPAANGQTTTYTAISDFTAQQAVLDLVKSYPDGKGGYITKKQPEHKTSPKF